MSVGTRAASPTLDKVMVNVVPDKLKSAVAVGTAFAGIANASSRAAQPVLMGNIMVFIYLSVSVVVVVLVTHRTDPTIAIRMPTDRKSRKYAYATY